MLVPQRKLTTGTSTRLIFLFKKEFLREEEDSFVMIVYICMGEVKAVMTL